MATTFNYLEGMKISHARKMLGFYFQPYYLKAYKDNDKRAYVCVLRKPVHEDPETLKLIETQIIEKMSDWRKFWGVSYHFEWGKIISKKRAQGL